MNRLIIMPKIHCTPFPPILVDGEVATCCRLVGAPICWCTTERTAARANLLRTCRLCCGLATGKSPRIAKGKKPKSIPALYTGNESTSGNRISVFLQRASITCYAERCISYDTFCLLDDPTVRPTVCLSHAGIMPKRLQLRS